MVSSIRHGAGLLGGYGKYVEIKDGLTILTHGSLFAYNKINGAYTIAALDEDKNKNYSYTIGYPVSEGEKSKSYVNRLETIIPE